MGLRDIVSSVGDVFSGGGGDALSLISAIFGGGSDLSKISATAQALGAGGGGSGGSEAETEFSKQYPILSQILPLALDQGLDVITAINKPDQIEINQAQGQLDRELAELNNQAQMERLMASLASQDAASKRNAQIAAAQIAANFPDNRWVVHAGTKAAEGKREDAKNIVDAIDKLVGRTQAGIMIGRTGR